MLIQVMYDLTRAIVEVDLDGEMNCLFAQEIRNIWSKQINRGRLVQRQWDLESTIGTGQ